MGMKRRMGISPEKIVGSQPKLEDILSLTTDTGCAIGDPFTIGQHAYGGKRRLQES
jgi:hypothetical protein